jgi:hypothetical protein
MSKKPIEVQDSVKELHDLVIQASSLVFAIKICYSNPANLKKYPPSQAFIQIESFINDLKKLEE